MWERNNEITRKDKMARDKVKKRGVESRNIWKYEVSLERNQRRKLWPLVSFIPWVWLNFIKKSVDSKKKKGKGYEEFYKQIIKSNIYLNYSNLSLKLITLLHQVLLNFFKIIVFDSKKNEVSMKLLSDKKYMIYRNRYLYLP